MPHVRNRQVLGSLKKKLANSRVVTLQGPRQCGKSLLAREILSESIEKYDYITFDTKQNRELAQNSPSSFLAQFSSAKTLAIDEAQKAPDLFDEIKAKVDVQTQPGQYLLLGSTEFSRETQIRESLTGRVSRQRLYPLNQGEANNLPLANGAQLFPQKPRIDREKFMLFLNNGGMPGIFAVRSNIEKQQKIQEWIEVTIYRDLLQFKKVKPDPELALAILEAVANLEFPDSTQIHSRVRCDLRKLKLHLRLLEQLFVLEKIPPHPLGTGKDAYFVCDPGIASQLGANFGRKIQTALLLELQSQAQYRQEVSLQRKLSYYRSSKGSLVDFVLETGGKTMLIKIIPHEGWDSRELRGVEALKEKLEVAGLSKNQIVINVLWGGEVGKKMEGMNFLPWESMA